MLPSPSPNPNPTPSPSSSSTCPPAADVHSPPGKRRRMSHPPSHPLESHASHPIHHSIPEQPLHQHPQALHAQLSTSLSHTTERYQAALQNAPHSIQPRLQPADSFFAQPQPHTLTTCLVCRLPFATQAELMHHIHQSHNTGYNPQHVSQPAAQPFPPLPHSSPITPSPFAAPQSLFPLTNHLPSTPQLPHRTNPWTPLSAPLNPPHPAPLHPHASHPRFSPNQHALRQIPMPPINPLEDDAPWKKSPYNCHICEISCDTSAVLETHLMGQRHRKKAEWHANFQKAAIHFSAQGISEVSKRVWLCNFCRSDIDGENSVLQHLDSSKHRRNVQANSNTQDPRKRVANPPMPSLAPSLRQLASHAMLHMNGAPPKRERVSPPMFATQPPVMSASLALLSDGANLAEFVNSSHNAPLPPVSSLLPSSNLPPSPSRNPHTLPIAQPPPQPTRTISKVTKPLRASPLPTLSSSPKSSPASVPQSLSCPMCSVTCNSMECFNAHLASAKHKRKQNLLEAASTISNYNGPISATPVTVDNSQHIRCEICNITCCGQLNFESHLRGKMHMRKLTQQSGAVLGSSAGTGSISVTPSPTVTPPRIVTGFDAGAVRFAKRNDPYDAPQFRKGDNKY